MNSRFSIISKDCEVPNFKKYEFHKKKTPFCLCIPVVNEGNEIKRQLIKLKPYSRLIDIIIADGGSTDKSVNRNFLKKNKIRTLLILTGWGKQSTQLRMAFAYALKEGYKGIVQIDGNNKDGVNAIPNFIKELDRGFDYLQGSRFIKGGHFANTPFLRYLSIRFLASPILSLGAKFWYTDVTNGFRGYSRKYLLHPQVKPFRANFISYELNMYLTVRANQIRLKTKELPVTRIYTKGKVHTKISFFKGNINFLLSQIKAALGFYNPK